MKKLSQRRGYAGIGVIIVALMVTACPFGAKTPTDIDKVENKLGQAANALNALAKTNRELYRKNVISLVERQRAAGIINKANSVLDRIEGRVYSIDPANPGSISAGKTDLVALLQEAGKYLGEVNFGPQELRLAAQAVIALLNEAIDVTQRIREVRTRAELRSVDHLRLTLLAREEIYHGR